MAMNQCPSSGPPSHTIAATEATTTAITTNCVFFVISSLIPYGLANRTLRCVPRRQEAGRGTQKNRNRQPDQNSAQLKMEIQAALYDQPDQQVAQTLADRPRRQRCERPAQ